MNIASLAVESTFVGIESTFVGHRKYLRLGFMNTVFSLPGNCGLTILVDHSAHY